MQLTALLDRLAAGYPNSRRSLEMRTGQVLETLPIDAPDDWRQLAAALAVLECERADSRVLGISGGQGAGKSTLAALLVQAYAALGKKAVTLSLDDFYLTRAERAALGARIHPLLGTRGVPGTHDVTLAITVLDALIAGRPCELPRFDKATDDRKSNGSIVSEPVDLVIFEGWCVGAQAEPESRLSTPVNDLERAEDPDGVWRQFVNDALSESYPALWRRLDRLLFLRVPDLIAVIRWRTQQEQALPPTRRMSAADVERFVAHYERLTRWMAENMVERADLVGFLDDSHRLKDLRVRKPLTSR